jgi:hypothetical protein
MDYDVVYDSNGKAIGDGIRIVKISDNGRTLEVLTDPVTGRFSKIKLKAKLVEAYVDIEGIPQVGQTLRADHNA